MKSPDKKKISKKAHEDRSLNDNNYLKPLKNTVASEKQVGIKGSTRGFENQGRKGGSPRNEGQH